MTLILNLRPTTLPEAIDYLEAQLTHADRQRLLDMPREETFTGLGDLLRPEWRLSDRETPLVNWMVQQHGIVHPLDISCLLMEALWARVHQLKPLTMKLAAAARAHWRREGRHPATMEPLPRETFSLLFPNEYSPAMEAPNWPHLTANEIRRTRPE